MKIAIIFSNYKKNSYTLQAFQKTMKKKINIIYFLPLPRDDYYWFFGYASMKNNLEGYLP